MDDATITSPFSGLLAFSGANTWVASALDATELVLVTAVTADAEIYRDPPDGLGVNTVRADVEELRSVAGAAGLTAPAPPFAFGAHGGWSAPVTNIGLDFGGTRVQYRWSSGVWARFQNGTEFVDATGRQVTPRNVLVQEVDTYASTTLFDVLGTASPTFDLVDLGRAYLFRDGEVIPGTWADGGPGAPVFRTRTGAAMKLAPGRTWIEMVPSSNGDLKGMVAY
jgi:hypothetical protein